MEASFGAESGIVHFWNEDDAAAAEQAMVRIDTCLDTYKYVISHASMQHCADVGGRNIAVIVFQQPRRAPSAQEQFNPSHAAQGFGPSFPVSALSVTTMTRVFNIVPLVHSAARDESLCY
jgi:hypothetical protein